MGKRKWNLILLLYSNSQNYMLPSAGHSPTFVCCHIQQKKISCSLGQVRLWRFNEISTAGRQQWELPIPSLFSSSQRKEILVRFHITSCEAFTNNRSLYIIWKWVWLFSSFLLSIGPLQQSDPWHLFHLKSSAMSLMFSSLFCTLSVGCKLFLAVIMLLSLSLFPVARDKRIPWPPP